jgi:NAD(P)-dependent dehydrogenase (short-subunit alcohol dehydrogenase family)
MAELRFDGRVAVITGAGRGIGRGYALLLAERGAQVLVNDLGVSPRGEGRSTAPAQEVVAEIRAKGGRAEADFGDAGSQDDAEAMVARAVDAFGRVDIVIANGGGVETVDPFGEMSRASFDSMVRTHLGGPFGVSRAAWPHMVRQGYGRIILTSSHCALGTDRQAHYCAAKAGVLGLMRALSVEGPPFGIQANAILPVAMTRLVAATYAARGEDAPAPLSMPPALVAPAAAWLAHESCKANGEMIGAGAGWVGRTFYGQTEGFADRATLTIEEVRDRWAEIGDETGYGVGWSVADVGDGISKGLAQAAGA